VAIHDGAEQIGYQQLVQHAIIPVYLFGLGIVPPRQVIGESTVLAAIDHTGSHGSELAITDELFLGGTRSPKATDLASQSSIAQFCRFADVGNLVF
jgi:hypothetical protein